MNATERRDLQRRIDRTRKLVQGIQQAAMQANDDLDMIAAIVRDSHQPDVGNERKPRANGKVLTEGDVLRIIDGVFGKHLPNDMRRGSTV